MENSDKKNLWNWIKKNSRLMKIFFFSLLIVFFIVLAFCRENLSLYLGDCIYFVTDSCRYFERRVRSLMDIIWQYKGCFLFLFSFSLMLYYLFPFENLRMGHFYRSSNRNRALFLLGLMSFLMYIGYGIARFYEEVPFLKTEIIPDTLLIAFLALPTAWGLWIWRNEDKTKELNVNETSSYTSSLLQLMKTIEDSDNTISIRAASIAGLQPYLYGFRGADLHNMVLEFIKKFVIFLNDQNNNRSVEAHSSGKDCLEENKFLVDLVSEQISKAFSEKIFLDYQFNNWLFWRCRIIAPQSFFSCCHFLDCKIESFFGKMTFKEVCFENSTISQCYFEDTMFSKCSFCQVSFANSKFYNCYFSETTKFDNSHFSNCEFVDCIFGDGCSFLSTSISASQIKNCKFGKHCSFGEMSFRGGSVFQKIKIGLYANFHNVSFDKNLPTNVFKEISIYNPEISALKSIQIKGIDSTVSEYDSFFPEKCSFLMKQMRDCTAIIIPEKISGPQSFVAEQHTKQWLSSKQFATLLRWAIQFEDISEESGNFLPDE